MKRHLLAAFALVAPLACASANGPSLDPARSNCTDVCEKAYECASGATTIQSCTKSCTTKSADATYRDKVALCADCLLPKSCSEAPSCAGGCFALVVSAS
jgi:hypothetical protein